MAVQSIVIIGVILAVFFFLHHAAKEKRRRETARRLFLKAKCLHANNRCGEAREVLRSIRWELVSKLWFEKFLDTDKVVTREIFTEFNASVLKHCPNDDVERLSAEELGSRINRIRKETKPPEGFDTGRIVSEVMEKSFQK